MGRGSRLLLELLDGVFSRVIEEGVFGRQRVPYMYGWHFERSLVLVA